jgi:hypothetical protein
MWMDKLTAQFLHHRTNVIFLKQTNGGDPGRSGGQAGVSVRWSNTSQSQDRDGCLARFPKKLETPGLRAFFFEDGSEDCKGRGAGGGLDYFFWGVTGDGNEGSARLTLCPYRSDCLWGDVVGAEVDAIGLDGQSDVGSGVDQELSSRLRAPADNACGLSGQRFQFTCGKIFFAKLDVVDSNLAGFPNFLQESATVCPFVTWEGGAVGDVVEKAGRRHPL